ncbi:hypothetical protein [Olleya aquimaris]|uniref:Uncharacterized protein n=1 Tax=Olleya aquimaris TaxID=639310 RepID=A0A327RKU0_9FLAO|nr:hypothetical protein [Olleya aquimaris]RAJ16224.1 hypothetical protein LY08_01082 [Olleya aquimaris]
MKNSIKNSIYVYALLFLSILFIGCGGTKNLGSVSQEVKKHFGEMNFTTTTTSEKNLTKLKTYKGKENFADKTGKVIEIRWLLVVKGDGKVSAVYAGAESQKVSNVFTMTEENINDRVDECLGMEGASLRDCYNQLMRDLMSECVSDNTNCDLVIWG